MDRTRLARAARYLTFCVFVATAGVESSAGISFGSADSTHEAVGLLVSATGACGATLVAPSVVLTAAQCVVPPASPPLLFWIGANYDSPDQSLSVESWEADPDFDSKTLEHDFALVYLSSSAVGVDPLPFLPPLLDDLDSDSQLVIVGYGSTESGANTLRRSAAVGVASAFAAQFTTDGPAQGCSGDSGAPAISTVADVEYIAGVAVSTDGACPKNTFTLWARISDAYDSFLSPAVPFLFADGFENGGVERWTSTVGFVCSDDAHEPNDSEVTAVDLGGLDRCTAIEFLGTIPDGDVDWFVAHGSDTGDCSRDPRVAVDSIPAPAVCLYVACDAGTTAIACGPGQSDATAPSGAVGCCRAAGSTGEVAFPFFECSGSASKDAEITVRIEPPAASCTTYAAALEF